MPDYKKMYHVLFNALTDAIRIMQAAQCETEELYMAASDPVLVLEKAQSETDGED